MENEIIKVYKEASESLRERWGEFLDEIEPLILEARKNKDKKKEELLVEYQSMINEYFEGMIDEIARAISDINKKVSDGVNKKTKTIYQHEYNGVATKYSFNFIYQGTIDKLLKNDDISLPQKKLNINKDVKWNKKKINSELLTGLVAGESVPTIANRIENVTKSNAAAAIRNARTMITATENGARFDSYIKAENELGLKLMKEWIATSGRRTRDSHRDINGEKVPIREKFSNGLMYPGDPNGAPAEVYNCRCTMSDDVMTDSREIVNGKDMSKTFKRNSKEHPEEIEDVLHHQGFDSLPQVVDKKTFDDAVKQTKIIAQRAYTDPSKGAFRDSYYNGKWYVSCAEGGSRYGQGMYSIANYTGKLTERISNEMEHYLNLHGSNPEERFIDTFTLDPSSKGILFKDLLSKYNNYQNSFDFKGEFSVEKAYGKNMRYVNFSDSFYRTNDKEAFVTETEKLLGLKIGSFKEAGFGADQILLISDYVNGQLGGSLSKNLDRVQKLMNDTKYGAMFDRLYKLALNEKVRLDRILNPSSRGAMINYIESLDENIQKEIREALNLPEELSHVFYDIGAYAASLGYDYIKVEEEQGDDAYTVILNRSKVIYLDPKYKF